MIQNYNHLIGFVNYSNSMQCALSTPISPIKTDKFTNLNKNLVAYSVINAQGSSVLNKELVLKHLNTSTTCPVEKIQSLNQIFNENNDVKKVLNDMPWFAERIPAETYYELGYRYREGRGGFEKDLKKSLNYYRLAADRGYAPAQWMVGHIYENGKGVAQDYQKAIEFFEKAADQNDLPALIRLVYSYLFDIRDDRKAVEYCIKLYDHKFSDASHKPLDYYQQGSDQGDLHAMAMVGFMYNTGMGVARDYQKAVEYYQKAADTGDISSQFNLGRYYEAGVGVEPNMRIANKWYQKAAVKGDKKAQYKIGNSWQRLIERFILNSMVSYFSPLFFAVQVFYDHMDSSTLQQKINAPKRLYYHPIEELKRKGQLILKKLNTMQNIFKRLTSRARCDPEKDFLEIVSDYALANHTGAVEFLTEYEQNSQ